MENYISTLEPDVRQRYYDKISGIGFDPYLADDKTFNRDFKNFPNVQYINIVNYMLFTVSAYTQQQLMNYKSLESYRLFSDGYVKGSCSKEVGDRTVIRSKVRLIILL